MATRRRKRNYQFKPDRTGTGFLKKLHLTRKQRLTLAKWSLYAVMCLLALVIQDVILSQVHIFGATTDLAVCAILLITVLEGSEKGSLFALIASTLYFFAGTAPGPYAIAYITIFGVLAALFREGVWRRGLSSTVLCAGVAMMLYEIAVFGTGIFLGLTLWRRCFIFALTGAFSALIMVPLYPIAFKIGSIGGEPWKE
jgi:hypothetical protein